MLIPESEWKMQSRGLVYEFQFIFQGVHQMMGVRADAYPGPGLFPVHPDQDSP